MTRTCAGGRWSGWALLLIALLPIGCSGTSDPPTAPIVPAVAPEPTSAVNVSGRVAWAFAHNDTAMTRGLYTYDYTFLLHPFDVGSIGDTDGLLDRNEELEFARRMRAAPPSSISFDFVGTSSETPDVRPGKDARFHRRVEASVLIRVHEGGVLTEISGTVAFFAVRGDSADIDDSIRGDSALPDSSRWYIDHIEDGTGGPLAVARREGAQARNSTLGGYKLRTLYGDL